MIQAGQVIPMLSKGEGTGHYTASSGTASEAIRPSYLH